MAFKNKDGNNFNMTKSFQDEIKPDDLNLKETDITWIAGIIEGEGSFGIDNRAKDRYQESSAPTGCYFKVSMTDQDVMIKFEGFFNRKPFSPKKKTKGGKTEYIINIANRKILLYILPRIFPYLGIRPKTEAQKCLDLLDEWIEWIKNGGKSQSAALGGKATANNKKNAKNNKGFSNENNSK